VIQSGGQGILRRTAHVHAGDDVNCFDPFSHKMESLAGEIGQMKDSGRLKLSFFLTKIRGNNSLLFLAMKSYGGFCRPRIEL
jgi:hypothetical protein